MTKHDELIERLQATTRGYGPREHMLINPDGPEAATALSQSLSQVESLTEALREARLQLEYMDERSPSGTTPAVITRIDAALAKEMGK